MLACKQRMGLGPFTAARGCGILWFRNTHSELTHCRSPLRLNPGCLLAHLFLGGGLALLVNAAAAVAEAALAGLEVVTDLVELHHRPGLAGLALLLLGLGGVHRAVHEAALLAALAAALVAEGVALASGLGLPLAAGAASALTLLLYLAVRELALLATLALAIVTEAEADALGAGLALAGLTLLGLDRGALVLADALVAVGAASAEEVAADLLAAVVAAGVVRAVAEAAAVAVSALTVVTEVEALTALTTFGLSNRLALGVLELAVLAKTAAASVAEGPADLDFSGVSHLKYV